MREENIMRNRAIVVLRKLDPKMYSFGHLSELFSIEKPTLHKIFLRDKDKYSLLNGDAVNKQV